MQDKTEPASQHRREDSRKDGRVAKSNDLVSAVGLIGCLLALKTCGPFLVQTITTLMRQSFSNFARADISMDNFPGLATNYIMKAVILCLPIGLCACAIGVTTNVLQVGMRIAVKPLVPDFSKLDPFKGLTKLFTMKSLVELIKSMLKVGIVGYVAYNFLRGEYPSLTRLAGLDLRALSSAVGELCWQLVIRTASAMLIIAALDYMYQRYDFEQSIKMTKQEVREEYKRMEGDPAVKGRIRQRQMAMGRKRMMADVHKADVIITNPTRLAIAIQYDPHAMNAPVVIAKGQRLVAQKIKDIAAAHGIPIVENKPVARLLYKSVEVGQPIPEDLYQAVAEILAFVYRTSRKAGSKYATSR
jgi:flagellar biosynthetic protein FlhB